MTEMAKEEKSTDSVLDWLLEPQDIGARYLALRDLVKADVKELAAAKKSGAHKRPNRPSPFRDE